MYIKIFLKPTFFNHIYLTPSPPHENLKINYDELFEIIWKHIRMSKKKKEEIKKDWGKNFIKFGTLSFEQGHYRIELN
jgi:hypothetical protein